MPSSASHGTRSSRKSKSPIDASPAFAILTSTLAILTLKRDSSSVSEAYEALRSSGGLIGAWNVTPGAPGRTAEAFRDADPSDHFVSILRLFRSYRPNGQASSPDSALAPDDRR